MSSVKVVAGIDVGGIKKGFHAVALQEGKYWTQCKSSDAAEVAAWCNKIGAEIVGIDAPCRWSTTGRARPAERELMAGKIWCFSTPSESIAINHPKDHFRWMLNGAKLYRALAATHPLILNPDQIGASLCCFETFPHAISWALARGAVSAKSKCTLRRELLLGEGVEIKPLKCIDLVDAALCAVTARYVVEGRFKTYGDCETGYIFVPTIGETIQG